MNTFLIYFHDTREDYICNRCRYFSEVIRDISKMPVKEANYFENQEIALRFFVYYVPYFVIRSAGKTYVLNPDTGQDLMEILDKETWRDLQPLKWYLDPNFFIVRMLAKALSFSFRTQDLVHSYLKSVPTQILYASYIMIIAYLIYSIKELINEILKDAKAKKD